MKKVSIFDDFYTEVDVLERDINEWIEEHNLDVISIDVKTYVSAFNDEICGDGTEQTVNCVCYYGIIVYEERK